MTEFSNKYDLEERTAKFGENVIEFCQKSEQTVITRPIISQLIRLATSVGANYAEANGASSKQDFRNKIFTFVESERVITSDICKKEIQETRHWLRMFAKALPDARDRLRPLWQECQKLTLIFGKISSTLRGKTDKLKFDD